MIYYFWASQKKYNILKEANYIEKPCVTCDREIIIVNKETKEFEIAHKHAVDLGNTFFSEDVRFCLDLK